MQLSQWKGKIAADARGWHTLVPPRYAYQAYINTFFYCALKLSSLIGKSGLGKSAPGLLEARLPMQDHSISQAESSALRAA